MAKKNVNLSPEERNRIMKLPMTNAKVGSSNTSGYLDAETGLFYPANEAGVPTGQAMEVPESYVESWNRKNAARASTANTGLATAEKMPERGADNGDADDMAKKKKKASVFVVILLIAALAVSAFIIAGPVLGLLPSSQATMPTSDSTTVVSSNKTDTTPESVVYVIQATNDILKGDVIKEDMLKSVTISVPDYNRLIASGASPCKWDEVSTVIGMYAGDYLKADQYINDFDVTVDDPVIANPWADYDKDEYSIVTLSVDDIQGNTTIFLGSLCDLEITREVTSIEAAAEEEPEETDAESEDDVEVTVEEITAEDIDGLTMEEGLSQSYTVNVYHVENGVICDILNEDGDSIYPHISQYIELPAVKQVSLINELRVDEDFCEDVEAKYIVVMLTSGQEKIIGDISGDKVVVSISDDVDNDTEAKAIVSAGSKAIAEILATELPEEE